MFNKALFAFQPLDEIQESNIELYAMMDSDLAKLQYIEWTKIFESLLLIYHKTEPHQLFCSSCNHEEQ